MQTQTEHDVYGREGLRMGALGPPATITPEIIEGDLRTSPRETHTYPIRGGGVHRGYLVVHLEGDEIVAEHRPTYESGEPLGIYRWEVNNHG